MTVLQKHLLPLQGYAVVAGGLQMDCPIYRIQKEQRMLVPNYGQPY